MDKDKKISKKCLTNKNRYGNIIKLSVIAKRKRKTEEMKSSKKSKAKSLQPISFTICPKEIYRISIDRK